MKRVFVAEHPIEAQFVKDFLASAGIQAVVRGEHLFALRGGVPMTEDTLPSVWLVDEEDVERATDLIQRLQARSRFRSVPLGAVPEAAVDEDEDASERNGSDG